MKTMLLLKKSKKQILIQIGVCSNLEKLYKILSKKIDKLISFFEFGQYVEYHKNFKAVDVDDEDNSLILIFENNIKETVNIHINYSIVEKL